MHNEAMFRKQRGFSVIHVLLALAAVSILGFASWFVYDANHDSSDTTTTSEDECTKNGIIIVIFNDDVSKDKQAEIISDEGASVSQEYKSINGYALHVVKGKEREAVDAFDGHNEVKSAGLNNCYSTTPVQ